MSDNQKQPLYIILQIQKAKRNFTTGKVELKNTKKHNNNKFNLKHIAQTRQWRMQNIISHHGKFWGIRDKVKSTCLEKNRNCKCN